LRNINAASRKSHFVVLILMARLANKKAGR